MKKSDVNKFERAVKHLEQAYVLLDQIDDSLWKQPTEWIHLQGGEITTMRIATDVRLDVHAVRTFAKARLKILKETLND